MKRLLSTVCLTVLLICRISAAEQAVVHAMADSMMLWVGEQTGLHIEVTCDAGQTVEFPQYADTIVRGLEIVPPVIADTQYVNDGQRITIRQDYTVTCFDSALIFIPGIQVKVDGAEYQSDPIALSFQVFEIHEGQENQIFPPKQNLDMPVSFGELVWPLLYIILAVGAVFLAIFLLHRYKDNKPIIRKIKLEPKVPAHVRALDRIESLRQSGSAHSQDPKVYYTDLTDILREYINERFGFNATEMTSGEILEKLSESRDRDSLAELAGLLSTSDMVKFAKAMPLLGENDRNLLGAVEFVKETMIEPDDQEPAPVLEETVVEEKRSKGQRIALLSVTIAAFAAAAALALTFVFKMYYLFF